MRWLTAILAILVVLLLAILFCCFFRDRFCHYARFWLPTRCSICALSPEGDAKLEVGQLGISIWKDGTVAIAVPITMVFFFFFFFFWVGRGGGGGLFLFIYFCG